MIIFLLLNVFDKLTRPGVCCATGYTSVTAARNSKGERAVLTAHPRALVFHTFWVLSPIGSNFVKMMLKVKAERPLLRVVNDQIGNPTSSLDLAAAMLKIAPGLQREPGGLYHLTGAGGISWHDFAAFIFEQSRKLGGPAPAL